MLQALPLYFLRPRINSLARDSLNATICHKTTFISVMTLSPSFFLSSQFHFSLFWIDYFLLYIVFIDYTGFYWHLLNFLFCLIFFISLGLVSILRKLTGTNIFLSNHRMPLHFSENNSDSLLDFLYLHDFNLYFDSIFHTEILSNIKNFFKLWHLKFFMFILKFSVVTLSEFNLKLIALTSSYIEVINLFKSCNYLLTLYMTLL